MIETDELRRDRREAIHYILHYAEERRKYNEMKTEAMSRPADENAGRKGAITHPTESAALASIQYDAKSAVYPWIMAVEATERGLGERKRIFLEVRRDAEKTGRVFQRGRRPWLVYVQRRFMEIMADRYNLSGDYLGETTIREWWYQIIDRVVDSKLRIQVRMLKMITAEKK